ncbi:MOSC domain-containing protein [Aquirhabdus sp.]|uniref:MOSC domain-containing protein n=1 Tax=Aquirhabdus sp. TaxID=2824160 RepID=UPI00396C4E7C
MSDLFLKSISHYPLKSAQGLSLTTAQVNPLGLEQDRRWVLVDEHDKFISQRSCAAMGGIRVVAEDQRLTLIFNGQTQIADANPDDRITATVWGDTIADCWGVQHEVNQWLSVNLELSVKLVYFPNHAIRPVDEIYAGEGYHTAFSDGYPVLVISQSSLNELSRLWGAPIDPRRFRANLIIGGECEPFAEDQWRQVTVGDVIFDLVKPCSRCVIPSLDPETHQQTDGFLRFLASVRRKADGKTYLGQNAVLARHQTVDRKNIAKPENIGMESHRQSIAENAGLLHTKKEYGNAPLESGHREHAQLTVSVGQIVRVR